MATKQSNLVDRYRNSRSVQVFVIFEVLTAVTIKHAVFWDIKATGNILRLRHRTQQVNA
jgi:hypothetical protein